MYNVSNAYKTAMSSPSRPYNTVYGTITLADDTTVAIDDSVLITNGISISKQCIDGSELMFGGVFLSTLNLSIMTDLDRYAFFGATVELNFKVVIGTDIHDDPIYEVVPLGIYEVSSADRNKDVVRMIAYDRMRLLDVDIGADVLQGRAWLIFEQVADKTGFELAFEETDLENFVNYDVALQIDGTRGCKTYRDVVKVVCQLMGCFAGASRDGKLEVREFGETSVKTLSYHDWYSIGLADYLCNYRALSVTGLAGTYTSESSDPDEIGNTMVIDDAPAWDYGLEETLQDQTDALFNYLHGIAYTPCDIDMHNDPAFDLGDRLTLQPYGSDADYYTLITSYDWHYHGNSKLVSEGTNPYLTGASSSEYSGSRIINQEVSESKVQFFNFTNPTALTIGDTQSALIGSLKFVATSKTNAMFISTILVDITVPDIEIESEEELEIPVKVYNYLGEEITMTDGDGNPISFSGTATVHHSYKRDGHMTATIYYSLNDVVYDYQAIDNLTAGRHIISVEHPITGLDTNSMYEWKIFMLAGDGTITVPQATLRATIFGQGITDAIGWDGNLDISDEMDNTMINITPLSVVPLYEEAPTVVTTAENLYNYSDNVGYWDMGALTPIELADALNVTIKELDWIWRSGENYSGDDANLL